MNYSNSTFCLFSLFSVISVTLWLARKEPLMDTRPPAVVLMTNLGLLPDPWQMEVLEAGHPRLLLNCCRQAGKSTVVAALGLTQAVFVPGTKVLLLSRSFRQSTE